MADTFLEANHIRKAFGGVQALDDVSLSIKSGEVCCLVGENGSGKSTLIKVIGGVVQPDEGNIVIRGRSYGKHINTIDAIREGIQIIYQDLSLFPNLTVAENIAMSEFVEQRRKLMNWEEGRQIAAQSLAQIEEELDLDARVEELSMAQRQLVAISRALTQEANLIIMDEPTSAITYDDVERLFRVVRRLNGRGIATLFVSHKLNEIFEIAEKVTVLRDGAKVGDYSAGELDRDKLTYLMTGRQLEYKPFEYDAEQEGAPVLLETRDLTKAGQYYDVDLKVRAGEIVGLTGLVGSGRTELALSVFGLNEPDSGEILVEGQEAKIFGPEHAKEYGISYLPEDRHVQGLFEEQSIADNIVVTVIQKVLTKLKLVDPQRERSVWKHWTEQLNIRTPSAHNAVATLSGGNQQRVVLAKWLATEPKVFLLDGPTIGVDVGSKARIHDVVQDLAREGMGILLITDEVSEALQVCSRVLVMRAGRIVEEFRNLRTVEEHEVMRVVAGADLSEVGS